ncbi:hypothetical protein BST61_g42 [Cercospora zeina]
MLKCTLKWCAKTYDDTAVQNGTLFNTPSKTDTLTFMEFDTCDGLFDETIPFDDKIFSNLVDFEGIEEIRAIRPAFRQNEIPDYTCPAIDQAMLDGGDPNVPRELARVLAEQFKASPTAFLINDLNTLDIQDVIRFVFQGGLSETFSTGEDSIKLALSAAHEQGRFGDLLDRVAESMTIWKSSLLASLFHGLQGWTDEELDAADLKDTFSLYSAQPRKSSKHNRRLGCPDGLNPLQAALKNGAVRTEDTVSPRIWPKGLESLCTAQAGRRLIDYLVSIHPVSILDQSMLSFADHLLGQSRIFYQLPFVVSSVSFYHHFVIAKSVDRLQAKLKPLSPVGTLVTISLSDGYLANTSKTVSPFVLTAHNQATQRRHGPLVLRELEELDVYGNRLVGKQKLEASVDLGRDTFEASEDLD